ncbi:MAG: MarR family transcriptional regulator [Deinococcota bacterium]|nr:MarR family transcriptional regulator [Deinococcota bacterium]
MRRSIADMMAMLQELELSMPQMGTLFFLKAAGTQSVSAIAKHLGLSLAATSHLVERLVGRDLVVRQEDPSDRRQKRVTLSASGLGLIAKADARATASLESMLEGVPPALFAALEHALNDVVDVLELD